MMHGQVGSRFSQPTIHFSVCLTRHFVHGILSGNGAAFMLLEQRKHPECFLNDDTIGKCHVSPLGIRLRLGQLYMMICVYDHLVVCDGPLKRL